jgi:SAM-dependent methyltransferase
MVQSAQRPIISASHDAARTRFSEVDVARNYPGEFRNHRRDRRERACLLDAIRNIPAGSHVLDLPCGSGRLTRLLLEAGHTVTGADVSPKMVELARQRHSNWRATASNNAGPAEFEIRDVMNTGYRDGQFGGVVCNRLFHHFNEASTRRAALAELRRICDGVLVASFFNSFALDAWRFHLSHMVTRTVPNDRVPIPYRSFASDVEAAGLKIRERIAKQWGISPMWYLVMERA